MRKNIINPKRLCSLIRKTVMVRQRIRFSQFKIPTADPDIRVSGLSISPDSRTLALVYTEAVCLWDMEKNLVLPCIDTDKQSGTTGVSFSPDGRAIIYVRLSIAFQDGIR